MGSAVAPSTGASYIAEVRVIARATLQAHWRKRGRADSEAPLKAWFREVRAANWASPAHVRAQYRSASFVGDRVVFNVAGNKYRLVVWVNFPHRVVYIRFVGTHAEYDKIDVRKV